MPQWGFVGPSYVAANPGQDNQELINWFVEYDPNEPNPQIQTANAQAKVAYTLLGTPGLSSLNSSYSGEVRAAHTLAGGTTALFVIGSGCYLGTSTGKGNLTLTSVGTLVTSSGRVRIKDSGNAGKLAVLVDGSNLYTYHTDTQAFAQSTDPGFLGATNVAEIDGWFTFNAPSSQKFYVAPVYWDGTTPFNGSYYALKDNAPDNLVTLIENNRELWLLGEATTEPWYNAGGTNFPFSRIEGALLQIGCAAAQSVARTGKGLVWLAKSERGSLSVVMTQGYQWQGISTPAVDYAINQYSKVSDAVGYTYSEEGHEFYVLTFPTADVTWVYDFSMSQWHKRASYDTTTGKFHRQRVSCVTNIGGMIVAGDYNNGRIYWQSRNFYADDQYPLVAMRRSPHVWDKNDRNRVMNARLQLDFFPGVGLNSGQGSDPKVILRWSNDGGQTWGNNHPASIGQIGQTKNRAIWRRLGAARDRVYEVRISDPVKRDVAGATLQAMATEA